MAFDWRQHLSDILTKSGNSVAPPSVTAGGHIPDGFDAVKAHHVDFKHGDLVNSVAHTLNTVKNSYHANGKSDIKTGHGVDAHLMMQDIAAQTLAENSVVPKYANGGRHSLHAVDTTPDGSTLRFHYASRDPMEPGHAFSLRGDGSLRYHGRTSHRNVGAYTSPFGLHDKFPTADD